MSAREQFLAASEYFRQSFFFCRFDLADPRLGRAYRAHRDSFRAALALLDGDAAAVTIPYGSTQLSGYLLSPAGTGEHGTVLLPAGYDSTAEAGYTTAVLALERGYRCLIFEGPGQGGVLYEGHLTFRHDYEAVLRPVVDWLVAQPGVDPSRLVLFGRSFAGYLALRGATGEPRLAALVLDPAQYDFAARLAALFGPELFAGIMAGRPEAAAAVEALFAAPPVRQDYLARAVTHGTGDLPSYFAELARFSARGRLGAIRCPTLVMDADDDFTSDGQADEVYADLTGPRTRLHLSAAEGTGGHCGGLGQRRVAQLVYDWVDEALRSAHPR